MLQSATTELEDLVVSPDPLYRRFTLEPSLEEILKITLFRVVVGMRLMVQTSPSVFPSFYKIIATLHGKRMEDP